MTRISRGAVDGSSSRPSCSWSAVRIDAPASGESVRRASGVHSDRRRTLRHSPSINHMTAHEQTAASLAIVVTLPPKAPLLSLNPHRRSGPCGEGGVLPGGALLRPPFEHAREADDDLNLDGALRQAGRSHPRDQEPAIRALVPRPVRPVEIRAAQPERGGRADVEGDRVTARPRSDRRSRNLRAVTRKDGVTPPGPTV